MNAFSVIPSSVFKLCVLSLLHRVNGMETNRIQWYNQLTTHHVSSLSDIAATQRTNVVIADSEHGGCDDPRDNDGGSKADENDILFIVVLFYQVEANTQKEGDEGSEYASRMDGTDHTYKDFFRPWMLVITLRLQKWQYAVVGLSRRTSFTSW